MSRSKINELNELLGKAIDDISAIASQYPDILIYHDYDDKGTIRWAESFPSVVQTFTPRLEHFRKQLRKAASQIKKPKK